MIRSYEEMRNSPLSTKYNTNLVSWGMMDRYNRNDFKNVEIRQMITIFKMKRTL